MITLNLTQHSPSPAQGHCVSLKAGLLPENKSLAEFLTFEEVPSEEEVNMRAYLLLMAATISLVELVPEDKDGNLVPFQIMLGGYFPLVTEIVRQNEKLTFPFRLVSSHSQRISIENIDPVTGETVKISKFAHVGWVKL